MTWNLFDLGIEYMIENMFKKIYLIESMLYITVHSTVLLLFVVLLKPSEIVIKWLNYYVKNTQKQTFKLHIS